MPAPAGNRPDPFHRRNCIPRGDFSRSATWNAIPAEGREGQEGTPKREHGGVVLDSGTQRVEQTVDGVDDACGSGRGMVGRESE